MKTSVWNFSLVFFFLPLSALSGDGTTGAEFLRMEYDARSMGMGGVSAAMARGMEGLTSNLAGLFLVQRSEAIFTHYEGVEGVRYDYAGYGYSSRMGTAAIGMKWARIDPIEGRDAGGISTGFYTADTFWVQGGWGQELLKDLRIGLGIFWLRERMAGSSASTAGVSAGFQYGDDQGWKVGGFVQNLGGGLKYDQVSSPLPVNIQVGTAFPVTVGSHIFTLAWDGVWWKGEGYSMRGGLEWNWMGLVGVRGGLRWSPEGRGGVGFFAGGGVKLMGQTINYAYAPLVDLGGTHRLTVLMAFE